MAAKRVLSKNDAPVVHTARKTARQMSSDAIIRDGSDHALSTHNQDVSEIITGHRDLVGTIEDPLLCETPLVYAFPKSLAALTHIEL